MKAVIELDVPEWQIGQDVSVYFPDTMLKHGKCELLKEQDAVEPIPPTDESDLWKCGNCNHQLFRCTHQRYCEMCGRSVKWK
jgi:hypothetical protein